MAPSFYTGAVVIIDPDIEPHRGCSWWQETAIIKPRSRNTGLCWFNAQDEQVFEFVSLNTDYR